MQRERILLEQEDLLLPHPEVHQELGLLRRAVEDLERHLEPLLGQLLEPQVLPAEMQGQDLLHQLSNYLWISSCSKCR